MRLFVKLFLGLLVVGFLGLGIYFGPAQFQTLTTAPDLPNEKVLRNLVTAENGPTSVKYILNASQPVDDLILAHTAFVVEWENGDKFVIDLGMDAESSAEFAVYFTDLFGAGEETFYGSVADQLGSDVANVKGVSATHLHADHVQGLEAFCEAGGDGAILLQTETQRDVHNSTTRESAEKVAQSCLIHGKLKGDKVLTNDAFPGVGIIPMGGHTPGAALIAVAVKGHLWLFAGDTTFTKADLLNNTSKPIIYTTFMIPENRFQNSTLRDWLRSLNAKDDIDVVISHDLLDIEKLPMIKFGS